MIEFPIIEESQGGQKNLTVKPRRGNVGNLGQVETTPRSLTGLFITLLISSTTWTLWEDHLFNIWCNAFWKMSSAKRRACQSGQSVMNRSPSSMLHHADFKLCMLNCWMLTANGNTRVLNSSRLVVVEISFVGWKHSDFLDLTIFLIKGVSELEPVKSARSLLAVVTEQVTFPDMAM